MAQPQKQDVQKYRDIRPKLSRDNWVSWKRELLTTAWDRGLYNIILGTDINLNNITIGRASIGGVDHIGGVSINQLIEEWNDRNNAAYNQILLNIAPD